MTQETVTIAAGTKLVTGLCLTGWAIVTQQVVASVIYAFLNAFTDAGRPRYFGGYVQEYLLWRLRSPTSALSFGELVANVLAAVVVVLAVVIAWSWLT